MPFDGRTLALSAEAILAEALQASGLAAIDRTVLERHKRREVERHPASWRARHQREVVLGGAAVLAGSVVGFMLLYPVAAGAGFALLFAGLAATLLPLVLPARGPALWQEREAEADLAQVHPAIRERALALKERLPETGFRVGELRQDRILLDPYLVADYRGAEAVIGIWDGERVIA
jgi:hypothetical protein